MSETPERIWACMDGPMVGLFVSGGYNAGWPEYVRADLFDAGKAERDDELLNIARQAGYQDGAEDRRKLEARVKALSEALEFYAAENTYVTHYEREACDCCTHIFEPINQDKGETARAALQENTDDR